MFFFVEVYLLINANLVLTIPTRNDQN